ncbi:MAG TPA: hypothetical protein VFU81_14270, partial [Thermomicrobiales bacterium]|nr:hypothetical protein [Thermomicrobiales bacterium]
MYTASDRALHRYELADNKDTVLTRGEVIGFGSTAISNPHWSPDGKWIAFTKSGRDLLPHVYVMPVAGGEAKRITDADTYSDSSPLWTPDGKALVYLAGMDSGNIGGGGRSTAQIFVVSLTRQEKEPGEGSIDSEEDAIRNERSRPGGRIRFGDRQNGENDRRDNGSNARKPVEVKIDFDRISRRSRQVTRSGDSVGAMAVAPDGKTLVFVTTGVEGGRPVQSIWSVSLESDQPPRRLTQASRSSDEQGPPASRGRFGGGLSSLQFDTDGRTLFYHQGSGIYALSLGGGMGGRGGDTATASSAPSPRSRRGSFAAAADASASAGGARRLTFTTRVEIDQRARRQQVFQESWRIMKHRFYDPAMHGVDWAKMRDTYEPLLAHVGDQ